VVGLRHEKTGLEGSLRSRNPLTPRTYWETRFSRIRLRTRGSGGRVPAGHRGSARVLRLVGDQGLVEVPILRRLHRPLWFGSGIGNRRAHHSVTAGTRRSSTPFSSRRIAAMLCSPRNLPGTIRIFSSGANFLRVRRRISRTAARRKLPVLRNRRFENAARNLQRSSSADALPPGD
jgi:hypothetical protein